MRHDLLTVAIIAVAAAVLAEVRPVRAQACWGDGQCTKPSMIEDDVQRPKRQRAKFVARPVATGAVKTATSEQGGPKLAIQVSQNDPDTMKMALNTAQRVLEEYQGKKIDIEIVTFGPGLHMLRADTSAFKDQIATMSRLHPNLKFVACANTQANQSRAEGRPVELVSEAIVTPSGAVRLIELQENGYAYVRP